MNEKTMTVKLDAALTLWREQSTKGKVYFKGTAGDTKVIAFYNTYKENPKEPDLRIYDRENFEKKVPAIGSFWVNVSGKGKNYLTGKLNGKKVVCFINENDNEDGKKRPYIKGYFRTDKPAEKEETVPVQTEIKSEKLPF